MSEGCLSIGEITVEVPRAVAIHVEAQDAEGEPSCAWRRKGSRPA